MPRKPQGVHARPENAGAHNFPKGYEARNQDKDNVLAGTLPLFKHGFKNREDYKGLWTEEDLERELFAYFDYCEANNVKVAKVGISLWLGINKDTMYQWANDKAKHGFKCDLIRMAFELVENSYIGRIERFPTGNIFLLKSSHGHIDSSKVEVTTTNTITSNEINEVVNKLGLDK